MIDDILTLEIRRGIYNFILKYPGLHLREISRRMDIPFSTLNYHLSYLDKRSLIKEKSEGGYTRFYVSNKIGRKYKEIINFLRKDTPRNIILLLSAYVGCSQTEISENLEKHPTTIAFHLKKLENMNIIERVSIDDGKINKDSIPLVIERAKVTNEAIYMLKNPELVYDLLITYKETLLDDATVGIILDYMNDFFLEGIPKKILSPKSAADAVGRAIFEIFPIPICA